MEDKNEESKPIDIDRFVTMYKHYLNRKDILSTETKMNTVKHAIWKFAWSMVNPDKEFPSEAFRSTGTINNKQVLEQFNQLMVRIISTPIDEDPVDVESPKVP